MQTLFLGELKRHALSKSEMRSIAGGSYSCTCNGHDIGTSETLSGCAAMCSSCVDEGGCHEDHKIKKIGS